MPRPMNIDVVLQKVIPEPNTGCWLWLGSLRNGYGQQSWSNKNRSAHTLVYELLVGQIPIDKELHHVCGLRCCVNPAHLIPVTPSEHVQAEMKLQGKNYKTPRWTHCSKGHEMGVYGGRWTCPTCKRERENQYGREKRKALGATPKIVCSGCGCNFDSFTTGCSCCSKRHEARQKRRQLTERTT